MLEAPAEIIELVDKFERNIEAYKNPNYKEEQLKQEFINPFFKASRLGCRQHIRSCTTIS